MSKYTITFTRSWVYDIEADNEEDALDMAEEVYNSEVGLDEFDEIRIYEECE